MKHSYLITFTAIITFGIGMLIATADVPRWFSEIDWLAGPGSEPVLVVLVGTRNNLKNVRAAISDERVIAETADAFALVEERIVAASAEAATAPLNLAGWVDREIELVAVPMDGGRKWASNRSRAGKGGSSGASGATDDPEKAARIAELMSKPTLTSGEAMTLLRHMDATGQF